MEGMFSRLKTKVLSAVNLDIPSIPAHVNQSGIQAATVDSLPPSTSSSSTSASSHRHVDNRSLPNKFTYNRPTFLQLITQDELRASADHNVRPIIVPRDISIMPWNTGYAECVNSGKSEWNEDQAAFYRQILTHPTNKDEPGLPYTYFGVFDGKYLQTLIMKVYSLSIWCPFLRPCWFRCSARCVPSISLHSTWEIGGRHWSAGHFWQSTIRVSTFKIHR